MKGSTVMVYDHVFLLSLLWKYAGKWGHIWRELDECGEQWDERDGLLVLYVFLCFV